MKKRLMLPAMAFVFAIGLSFATESSTADAVNDWIDMGTHMQAIPEQPCDVEEDEFICTVRLGIEGPSYEVYDSASGDDLKYSSSEADIILPAL